MLKRPKPGPLADHREAARLTLVCKIMHNHVSIPPADLVLQPTSQRTTSSHNRKLHHLNASTEAPATPLQLVLPQPRTIPTSNKLSADVAEAYSIETYKSQLAAQATPWQHTPHLHDTL